MPTLDKQHWPLWSRFIAAPSDPIEYCEAATERLMKEIADYIVDVKNVRPQFNAHNRIMMIDFDSPKDEQRYNQAYEKYCLAVNKLEGHTSSFAQLVEWLKFRQEAELIRAPILARQMNEQVEKYGMAAVCACNFKATIAKVAHILYSTYGVPRKKISLIWGGSSVFSATQEERFEQDEIQALLASVIAGGSIDLNKMKKMKQQLLADIAGLGNLPPELNLGPQDYEQRQEEIDRFQSGEALYCLFNFKSGGVGLSLHHTDEMTKQKVRRKPESNFAYEEDIPNITTRPRVTFLAPTYSAIELVQGLGRAPRLTSLSDTSQIIVFYRGTIEVAVATAVSAKLKCLKKVIRQRESWEDVIMNKSPEVVIPVDESVIIQEDLLGDDEEDEE
jgi:hypothetical protein